MKTMPNPIWIAIASILTYGVVWTILDLLTGKFKRK